MPPLHTCRHKHCALFTLWPNEVHVHSCLTLVLFHTGTGSLLKMTMSISNGLIVPIISVPFKVLIISYVVCLLYTIHSSYYMHALVIVDSYVSSICFINTELIALNPSTFQFFCINLASRWFVKCASIADKAICRFLKAHYDILSGLS